MRAALGKRGPPLNAVVSGSGDLDLRLPLFASGKVPALIVTSAAGERKLRKQKVPDTVAIRAVRSKGKAISARAVALKAAKAAIDGGLDADLNTGLKLETSLFTALWATEDQANGMRSFIENGPGKATFEGK